MLEELTVSNLGIVPSASVALSGGLTVITGETGAGKTLVVEALGLLLGARAAAGMVGPNGIEARVDGRFRAGSHLRDVLDDAGLDHGEDDELVLSRRLVDKESSRAWVNGRPVTAGQLSDVGDLLVAVHGQHAHRRLLTPGAARGALDSRAHAARASYDEAWARWRRAVEGMAAVGGTPAEREREADRLRFEIRTIGEVAPKVGEEAELEAAIDRLGNAQDLRDAALVAHEVLDGPASDAIGEAVARLRGAPGAVLSNLAAGVAAAQEEVAGLARALRTAAEGLEDDPAALDAALSRRTGLHDLRRKYGETLEEVLDYAKAARARLDELEGYDQKAQQLAAEEQAARQAVDRAATRLTEARIDAAADLGAEVMARLPQLAMPGALFTIGVEAVEPGPAGADRVSFFFSANPGSPPQSLQKVASGGELSRLMLALELVLRDPTKPTLVFDEVDAGVGGAAGAAVGALLAELATHAQVLCVTHLAQVAAHATDHVVVRKEAGRAEVIVLDHEGRRRELSRMLAGHEGSRSAMAHADELLEAARQRKRQ